MKAKMEVFRQRIRDKIDRLMIEENHPKLMNRSVSIVMLAIMHQHLIKLPASVAWHHQTIKSFKNMLLNPEIRQCWPENQWQKWTIELEDLERNLPPEDGIALAA